ncbi:MAG: hypothetical protein ACR2KK_21745 [Acidimicrobiales bacterium]
MALVCSATFAAVGLQPAAADVTAVRGSACAYVASVSLFGGPVNVRGCGQPAGAPAANASPSVTLPAGGSATPIEATDADGAVAQYGPALIFSGQYPNAANDPGRNASSPPSGPLSVGTRGTTGAGGSVTSSASVTQGTQGTAEPNQPRGVGPGPIIADAVRSTCTASESGVSGETTITNGILETKYNASTQDPIESQPVPEKPPVNYTRSGTIDHVGDNFTVIYNEHITAADGTLTVNAVHLKLLGPTAVGDLIIGQSVCGITASAAPGTTTTTTQAGATTTTQAGATTTTQAQATTTTSATSGTTTTTSGGGGGSVSGRACGYFADVSLFGGPKNLRGCGQPASAPATNASPSVTLPAAGSATPITASDPDGATADYGPAKIFAGKYPDDPNAVAPPSGPLNVSTEGTPGAGGKVTSSASVGSPRGVGPAPVVADGVSSTCTASESGVSGSTTITNGKLETKYDASTQDPTQTEDVPASPTVNYTRSGTLDHIGDKYTVIYNEQITAADGTLTVNAVHMKLEGPTAVGDLVIAQSVCSRTAGGGSGTGAGGGGSGGVTTAASGGVANTGTNALRMVAFAMLLVVAGAQAKHWAPQLEWSETTFAGRRWPRRVRRLPRPSKKRPWD